MNRNRRKSIENVILSISNAKSELTKALEIIDFCKDEEEESYDNLPESIQDEERGEAMQEAIDYMSDAFDTLDEIVSSLDDVIESLESAID